MLLVHNVSKETETFIMSDHNYFIDNKKENFNNRAKRKISKFFFKCMCVYICKNQQKKFL